MSGLLIIATCIGGTILIIATIGLMIIGIIRVAKTGGLFKKDKLAQSEETRMIQEIYHGLSKMEERVEALETILIERKKEKGN